MSETCLGCRENVLIDRDERFLENEIGNPTGFLHNHLFEEDCTLPGNINSFAPSALSYVLGIFFSRHFEN